MEVKSAFKNVKNSEVLSEYIEQKISEMVLKYLRKEVSVDITFLNSASENRVHCRLSGGDFLNMSAEGVAQSMPAAIEQMLTRLDHQAARKKEKTISRQRQRTKISKIRTKGPTTQEKPIDAEDIIAYERKMQSIRKAS